MEKQSSDNPVCSKCKSTNITKYLWGFPVFSNQLMSDVEEGRVILSGCIINGGESDFYCNNCKYEWNCL